MDAGQFMQIGTPTEIYEFPESRLIANFIGSANMFEGRVTEDGTDHIVVQSNQPECTFYVDHGFAIQEGSKVWAAVRPEKIRISSTPPESAGPNQMKGIIDDIGYLGKLSTYRVRVGDNIIIEIIYNSNSMVIFIIHFIPIIKSCFRLNYKIL